MNSFCGNRRWGPVAVLGLALVAAAGRADDRPVPQPADKGVARLLREEKELEERRKTLGAELFQTLKDKEKKLTPVEKEDILLALGKLRYEPAIDYTVSRIAAGRAFRGWDSGREGPVGIAGWNERYPAIQALWDHGTPAVPALVKGYVAARREEAKRKPKDNEWRLSSLHVVTLSHPALCAYTLNYLDESLAETRWRATPEDEVEAWRDLLDELIRAENRRRGTPSP